MLACPSAPQLDGIAVALVDVADRQRWQRLEQRDPGQWDTVAKRRFIGWARWQRAHAADPRAHPQVLTDGSWERMRWDTWVGWTSDDARWRTTLFDTTDRAPAESATEVRAQTSPCAAWRSPCRTA